jgi:hypothetical protein
LATAAAVPHIVQLSNAFHHPNGIDEIVSLRDKDHVNVLNVRVHWDETVCKIVVDVARDAPVDLGCFMMPFRGLHFGFA